MIKIKNNYGEKLAGILDTNKNSKELIIICHGARSSKNSRIQTALAQKLKQKYNIFRFDFSGNNDSEGQIENATYSKDIEDLMVIVNHFIEKGYKIKSVIGHSKSGSEVLLASKQLINKTKTIITLAPRRSINNASEMTELKKHQEFFDKNQYYWFPDPNVKHKITSKYIDDAKKWNNITEHYTDQTPTLVIHGTDDDVIDISEAELFVKEFENIKFFKIKNASHGFENHLEELSEIISNYLEFSH